MTALLEKPTAATNAPAGEAARFLSAPTVYTSDGAPVALTWVWSADGGRFTLSCWEMALALVHSGTQLHLNLPADEITDLVVRGVRALGGPESLAAVQAADLLNNCSERNGQITVTQWRRARKAWWPTGRKQESVATLLALTLSRAAREAMFTRSIAGTVNVSPAAARTTYPAYQGAVVQHVWTSA